MKINKITAVLKTARHTANCKLNKIMVAPGTVYWRTLTLLISTQLYSTLLYSTLLYSTLLYSTLLYSTLLYSTLHSTLLYSTLLYSTLLYWLYSTLLYSTLLTLLYSTLLYSTLLYSTLLYSTLLYSTLLYSTLLYSTLICQIQSLNALWDLGCFIDSEIWFSEMFWDTDLHKLALYVCCQDKRTTEDCWIKHTSFGRFSSVTGSCLACSPVACHNRESASKCSFVHYVVTCSTPVTTRIA